jgi:hypothetical protein
MASVFYLYFPDILPYDMKSGSDLDYQVYLSELAIRRNKIVLQKCISG